MVVFKVTSLVYIINLKIIFSIKKKLDDFVLFQPLVKSDCQNIPLFLIDYFFPVKKDFSYCLIFWRYRTLVFFFFIYKH